MPIIHPVGSRTGREYVPSGSPGTAGNVMREIYIVPGYPNASATGQATPVTHLGALIADPLPFFVTVHGIESK